MSLDRYTNVSARDLLAAGLSADTREVLRLCRDCDDFVEVGAERDHDALHVELAAQRDADQAGLFG